MNLTDLLEARRRRGTPVRAALIGAGKFGSMFLAQVPSIPGLEVPLIADLRMRSRERQAGGSLHYSIGRSRRRG